jgi:hypothetical protein
MKKLPYREGDIFAVPLQEGGFVLGVVARMPKGGKILLGYFFKEKFFSVPRPHDLPVLLPENVVKVVKFGDLSLMTGEWPVVGRVPDWDRADWPIPKFIRRDDVTKRAWLISYADDNPGQEIAEERCDFEASGYERASLLGAGLVEILMSRLAEDTHGTTKGPTAK